MNVTPLIRIYRTGNIQSQEHFSQGFSLENANFKATLTWLEQALPSGHFLDIPISRLSFYPSRKPSPYKKILIQLAVTPSQIDYIECLAIV